jgi:hypothetical protein
MTRAGKRNDADGASGDVPPKRAKNPMMEMTHLDHEHSDV